MKFIILCFLLLVSIHLFANPMIPKLISELYVDDTSWWMEISLHDLEIGDSIRISSKTNMIQFPWDESMYVECYVINSNQYPLIIDPESDSVSISIYAIEQWFDIFAEFYYDSEYPNNCVEGQSLVMTRDAGLDGGADYLSIEASPTPGSNPFNVTTFGSISGYVRDHNLNPVPNARITNGWYNFIGECETDINGHFFSDNLQGHSRLVCIFIDNTMYSYQTVNVIPNQTSTCDFILTDYYVSNQDLIQTQTSPIMISPNPIHAGSEIKFSFNDTTAEGYALKLYNVRGESVSELYSSHTSGEIALKLPSDLASGIYLYKLGNGNKILKKGKFTIIE